MDEYRAPGTIRPRISNAKRLRCLRLFMKGCGYKQAAKIVGLNQYTVREYLRSYKAGDVSWAERGGDPIDD